MQDRIKATVNCDNGPYTISLSAKDNIGDTLRN